MGLEMRRFDPCAEYFIFVGAIEVFDRVMGYNFAGLKVATNNIDRGPGARNRSSLFLHKKC